MSWVQKPVASATPTSQGGCGDAGEGEGKGWVWGFTFTSDGLEESLGIFGCIKIQVWSDRSQGAPHSFLKAERTLQFGLYDA